MLASLLVAASFQVGPFYQQRADDWALRPFVSQEGETTDVLWPLYTSHRDWWRFCYLLYGQDRAESEGYQFVALPLWFNGYDPEAVSDPFYWCLFPLYGRHPHIGLVYDFEFCLWPFWHHYRMPRGREWLDTNAVLFPFVSWRSDGAWSFWPFYGVNYQRESDHRYALWPIVTWADYRADRDTAGAGSSWMVWPLYGVVNRQREKQTMVLPPFFSVATTWGSHGPAAPEVNSGPSAIRVRCPWPLVELETSPSRNRVSFWPFYESVTDKDYLTGKAENHVTRFGWKLVELYDDETRVFPFYASGRDHFRLWPLWETEEKGDVAANRALSLLPIRWVPAVDRNWSKFWTLYENETCPLYTDHALLWGLIRWRTMK